MRHVFRSLPIFPADLHQPSRRSNPFQASFDSTMALLERELQKLGAREFVIEAGYDEGQIRQDGMPYANARSPHHDGVIISFKSKHGPLRYGTDRFHPWTANLRAIALGLEALRKVDRYGIGKRGEQYAGYKALPSGDDDLARRGDALIRDHGGARQALKATHPDHGGDAEDFRAVRAAQTT